MIDNSSYGESVSSFYDLMYPPVDVPDIVDYVRNQYPAGARIVDFGVGTGRTAIPLAVAGHDVTGVEASPGMVEVLRDKDPDEMVKIIQGDFTKIAGDGSYDLCMVLNNTFFMLLDNKDRINALQTAFSYLRPGGRLILETYAAHSYLDPSREKHTFTPLAEGDLMLFDKIDVDPVQQRIVAVRSIVGRGTTASFVEISRFSLPQDMDLLASTAGFDLVARYATWTREPLRADAAVHITEYQRREDA